MTENTKVICPECGEQFNATEANDHGDCPACVADACVLADHDGSFGHDGYAYPVNAGRVR